MPQITILVQSLLTHGESRNRVIHEGESTPANGMENEGRRDFSFFWAPDRKEPSILISMATTTSARFLLCGSGIRRGS